MGVSWSLRKRKEEGKEENAKRFFSRSLILKSQMVYLMMDILKELEIEFIVSPYEADA